MSKLLRRLVLVGTPLLFIGFALSPAFRAGRLVGIVPAVCAQGNPAEGTKMLLIDRLYRTDPIEILRVLGDGKEAEVGPPTAELNKWVLIYDGGHYSARGPAVGALLYKFQSDENWLSTLSFVLRNRTSKRIVLVAFTIVSPLPGPPQPGPPYVRWAWRLSFGRLPAILAHTRAGDRLPATAKNPIHFDPGQGMTFALADDKPGLRRLVAHAQPLSDTSLCRVRIRVVFEDGLQWHEGDYYKPDPERPGESILMAEDYFPGPVTGLPTQ